MTDATYIHGTDSAEQARLTELNEVLNARCLRELALGKGDRVLDVGCGLAQLTRAMGRATGRQVLGVERSQSQISEALRQARAASEEHLIELRQGDATALPLAPAEARSFDVAHARFILEHVADPLAVVRQMARAVRDGGRLVLVDDDHSLLRLHPEPPHFGPTWDAFVRSYHRLGNDPFVGRRLPALLPQPERRPFGSPGSSSAPAPVKPPSPPWLKTWPGTSAGQGRWSPPWGR